TKDLKREVVKNVVMTGALFRLLEFDRDEKMLRQLLEERFGRKGPEIVTLNMEAARRGRAAIEAILAERGWTNVGYRLEPRPKPAPGVYINGNEALVIAAIEAGAPSSARDPIISGPLVAPARGAPSRDPTSESPAGGVWAPAPPARSA